ncbi:MAG TPA: hypothetical protein VGK29_27450 [Paludibaculum sp.]|jgi:hypothetical protein
MSLTLLQSYLRISASILLFSLGAARADEIITFNYVVGGTIPQPEVRRIVSGVPVSITMTASANGGTWLKASLSSNTTPADLTIAIQPDGLLPAEYSGFVNITAGPVNTLAYIVRLNVKPGGTAAPTVTVSPASLELTVDEGDMLLPQRINVSSSGDALDYELTTSSSPNWLDVVGDKLLPNGNEGGRTPGYFFAVLTSKTLAPAVYTGRITVYAGGASNSPVIIPVRLTVLRGQRPPGAATVTRLLPQFVFGGGWYTALYLGNSGTGAATVTTQFFNDDGTALSVPGVGGSVSSVVPAKGSVVLEAQDVGPLTSGWAKVTLPTGVTGFAVFRQSSPGAQAQEAVVPLSNVGATTLRLLFDERSFDTAAAILNSSDGAVTVAVTARDNAGQVIGSATFPLKANGKTAMRLRDLPELTLMQGRQGTIEITSTQAGLAALGLRFNGGALTSIPVTEP